MYRFGTFLVLILLASSAIGQTPGIISSNANQIVSQEVVISGTTTLDTQQLDEIVAGLTGLKMSDNEQEVSGRIRDAFMQRGYLLADARNIRIRALDPLAKPKTVRIEADVTEGTRFKFGETKFSGNQAIPTGELLKSFPIADGDFYNVGKLRSGMDSMRKQYFSKGFLDFFTIPQLRTTNGNQAVVTFDITEGPQYRMGSLELVGNSANVDTLQQRWKLEPGDPFDAFYLEKFLDENSNLLSPDFSARNDAFIVRNCKELRVSVHVELDPKRPWKPRPQNVDCNTPNTR